MKVLMTTDTVGGVWTYALQLAKALCRHDVHVLLATLGLPSASQRSAAQACENVTLVEGDFRLEWMPEPWKDVAAAGQWLLELAAVHQPDLVHLNNFAHGDLPFDRPVLVAGHSCVLSWHQAVRGGPAGAEWNEYRSVVHRGLQGADMVAAPTRAMLRSLEDYYGPLGNTRVILNGSDPAAYRPGEKESFIFSAGRLWDEAKNVKGLVRAAPLLRWPVRLAGLPHPERPLDQPPDVEFLGQLSPQQMAAVYARASIYALPAHYEPFGLTALEAAHCGCALVLGDIDSLREIWNDAACFVDSRHDEELVDVLVGLIAHAELRERLGRAAQQRAAQLTASRMADAYASLYRELMPSWRRRPVHAKEYR